MVAKKQSLSNDQRRLLPQHQADLHKSGLSDEQISACGFYSEIEPGEVARLLNWKAPATVLGPCLVIPFPGAGGYCRVKPDHPRMAGGKAVKYESPRRRPNRAYFPPRTRAVLADSGVPLILTEGEKKAAKADQEGFPAVGLVGVWGWMQKRKTGPDGRKVGEPELIPDLIGVKWKRRLVTIIFDSDAVKKPGVRKAEAALAKALTAAGAMARIARLPEARP